MQLKELAAAVEAGQSPTVELHALEQVVYVAFVVENGERKPIKAPRGQTMQWPGRYQAMRVLASTGLSSLEFVHRTGYDEMIGSAGSQAEMREQLSLVGLPED